MSLPAGGAVPDDPPTLLDAAVCPDDVAAWAAGVTPGSAVVTPLAGLDPARLSAAGRIDAVAALEKQLAWLQAAQLRLLAVLAAAPYPSTGRGELDRQWVREDVAAALRLSAGTAADRLELASELTRLPATLTLLERGEITVHHARTLAEAIVPLDDATAAAVEAAVLPQAPTQSLASFRKAVRKAVLTHSAPRAEERHAQAMTERRVVITSVADGMSQLWALLPAQGAAALKTALDRAAAACATDDPRTVDQRRADTLVDLALGGGAGGGSLRPSVQVTVALSTLLAMDDQPGLLDGHGPIPAGLARRIAADESGTWRRLVTDQHGRLLDYGRTSYRPPADLADFTRARDVVCRFPNCHQPARRADLDHITAWNDGGGTSEQNLHALCPRHHALKHDTRWKVRRTDNGTTDWTSPTGHHYDTPPNTLPIDHTVDPPPDTSSQDPPDPSGDPDPPF